MTRAMAGPVPGHLNHRLCPIVLEWAPNPGGIFPRQNFKSSLEVPVRVGLLTWSLLGLSTAPRTTRVRSRDGPHPRLEPQDRGRVPRQRRQGRGATSPVRHCSCCTPSALRGLVSGVRVTGLQPDLSLLSYDDLFARYKAAVAALNHAGPGTAARIERDLIAPLNEELTRRSRQRRPGVAPAPVAGHVPRRVLDSGRSVGVDVG